MESRTPARGHSNRLTAANSAPGFFARPWADRVQLVDATYDAGWTLPVIGSAESLSRGPSMSYRL